MISVGDYALLMRSLGIIEGTVCCADERVKTAVFGELEIIEPILEKLEEGLKHE
jgi:hypothetical protein